MSPIKKISIIIPARNEETQISQTLTATLKAAASLEGVGLNELDLHRSSVEVIVVDNLSTDRTLEEVGRFVARHGVAIISCSRLRAPCARNLGAQMARGTILVFIDADTWIPRNALRRVSQHVDQGGYEAGICRLAGQERGLRSALWWAFWGFARQLPIARAKAMPAFMFCTREVFDQLGPFDEDVVIGEEWPILADLWRARRRSLIYDRSVTALSSSRRMALQPFGYSRTFLKYIWAILHQSGRVTYPDTIRQPSHLAGITRPREQRPRARS